MKFPFLVCVAVVYLIGCSPRGSDYSDDSLVDNPINDSLKLWLKPGLHNIDLMTGYTNKSRIDSLSTIMTEASKKDPEGYMNILLEGTLGLPA